MGKTTTKQKKRVAKDATAKKMVRKQVYIRADQQSLLSHSARRGGISEAELIRKALDAFLRDSDLVWRPKNPQKAGDGIKSLLEAAMAIQARGPVTGEKFSWNRQEMYDERDDELLRRREKNRA